MFKGNTQFSHPASEGIGIYSKELSGTCGTAYFSPGLLKGLTDLSGHRFIKCELIVACFLPCPRDFGFLQDV
jgi:hypothetical protein